LVLGSSPPHGVAGRSPPNGVALPLAGSPSHRGARSATGFASTIDECAEPHDARGALQRDSYSHLLPVTDRICCEPTPTIDRSCAQQSATEARLPGRRRVGCRLSRAVNVHTSMNSIAWPASCVAPSFAIRKAGNARDAHAQMRRLQ
jgi:hypothetical protein